LRAGVDLGHEWSEILPAFSHAQSASSRQIFRVFGKIILVAAGGMWHKSLR